MTTSINLAVLPAVERHRIELDKRASFLMWSLVLQQPRKRGEPPITRIEVGRELLDQRDINTELYAWFRDRINHYMAHYKRERDGDREDIPQAPLPAILDIYKGDKTFEEMDDAVDTDKQKSPSEEGLNGMSPVSYADNEHIINLSAEEVDCK
jgi:hypothetical protein